MLRPRLRAVAAAVPQNASVLDVGAGDGQLALALAAGGHRVIATEARPAPLARLRQHVGQVGIDCRPGDGLAAVTPGEVEVAVLAGMGGRRIIRILEADPEVAMQMEALVLQPMQHLDEVRVWLAERGLKVCSEAESVERGRRYTVLVVRGGDGSG